MLLSKIWQFCLWFNAAGRASGEKRRGECDYFRCDYLLNMNTLHRSPFFLSLAIAGLLFVSCGDRKEREYTTISGVWTVEESGDVTSFRRYNASIYPSDIYPGVYVISNLGNLGDRVEVLAEANGQQIIVRDQMIQGYSFEGEGVASGDFTVIDLQYRVFRPALGYDENIEARFVRQ